MGNRALAHVEKVVSTYPIEGADNVEMAQVLDFHVLVKKGEFKVGDLAVYVEVDSVLPDHRPEFEFLRSKKFRVKAMKYNKFGIISQGILFPFASLGFVSVEEGQDVTQALGVTRLIVDPDEDAPLTVTKNCKKKSWLMRFKWYRKLFANQKDGRDACHGWPDFLPPQSDESGVQNVFGRIAARHPADGWVVTEKVEGQNFSVFLRKRKSGFRTIADYGVCSRTGIKQGDNGFTATAKRLKLEEKMRKINKSIVVRGEHCGPKIQGNIYKLPETKVFVFEVYDIDAKRFYTHDELVAFCKEHDFEMVPIIDDNFTLPATGKEMLDYSNGKSVLYNTLREGVVVRRRDDPTVSFKARSPEYLVKQK